MGPFLIVTESTKSVECRVCGRRMPAHERKAKLQPIPANPRFFYYYHVDCLLPELQSATESLAKEQKR